MCVCMCICGCVCMCVFLRVCFHGHVRASLPACVRACAHVHVFVPACVRWCMPAYMLARVCAAAYGCFLSARACVLQCFSN